MPLLIMILYFLLVPAHAQVRQQGTIRERLLPKFSSDFPADKRDIIISDLELLAQMPMDREFPLARRLYPFGGSKALDMVNLYINRASNIRWDNTVDAHVAAYARASLFFRNGSLTYSPNAFNYYRPAVINDFLNLQASFEGRATGSNDAITAVKSWIIRIDLHFHELHHLSARTQHVRCTGTAEEYPLVGMQAIDRDDGCDSEESKTYLAGLAAAMHVAYGTSAYSRFLLPLALEYARSRSGRFQQAARAQLRQEIFSSPVLFDPQNTMPAFDWRFNQIYDELWMKRNATQLSQQQKMFLVETWIRQQSLADLMSFSYVTLAAYALPNYLPLHRIQAMARELLEQGKLSELFQMFQRRIDATTENDPNYLLGSYYIDWQAKALSQSRSLEFDFSRLSDHTKEGIVRMGLTYCSGTTPERIRCGSFISIVQSWASVPSNRSLADLFDRQLQLQLCRTNISNRLPAGYFAARAFTDNASFRLLEIYLQQLKATANVGELLQQYRSCLARLPDKARHPLAAVLRE